MLKNIFLFAFILIGFLSNSALGAGVELHVSLSPAGSFVARTKNVAGHVIKNGDSVTAKDVVVDVKSLDSGIELRNKHMLQRLQADKFPKALLLKAEGKGGKGKATIKVKDITKEVEGTYTIDDKGFEGRFPLKMSEFGIEDVNYMGVGADDEFNVVVALPVKAETSAPAKSETKVPAQKAVAKPKVKK
jgi:hypothetical protein